MIVFKCTRAYAQGYILVKIYEKFVRFLFKLVWRETQQKFHFRVNFFCNPNA